MKNSNLFGSKKINSSKSLLKNQAYELLKNAIINNNLKTDKIYSQEFLSKSLGISRTPVREALLQLQNEGIICIYRGRGIQVITTTIYDLRDILELDWAIECKMAQLAAERITDENLCLLNKICEEMLQTVVNTNFNQFMEAYHQFHSTLAKASGNKKFVENIEVIHEQLLRSGVNYETKYLQEIVEEHKEIIVALNKRCSNTSFEAMDRHLNNNYFRIMDCIEKSSLVEYES